MMNVVWGGAFVSCLIYGIFAGKGGELAGACMDGALEGVKISMTLLGSYALWMGMMNWVRLSGASERLARALRPLFKHLFPGVSGGSEAERAISMNLAANMLGVGNAATPLGIEAMREMKKLSPTDEATDAMCMFLIINASSIQLIPGTVILLRAAAGSSDPNAVVLPGLIATICSTLAGVLAGKLMARRGGSG